MFYDEIPDFMVPAPLDQRYVEDALKVFDEAREAIAGDNRLVSVSAGYVYLRKEALEADSFDVKAPNYYANPESDDIFVQVTIAVPNHLSSSFAKTARELPARIKADYNAERRLEIEASVKEANERVARLQAELDALEG